MKKSFLILAALLFSFPAFAQDAEITPRDVIQEKAEQDLSLQEFPESAEDVSSEILVRAAWAASGENNLERLNAIAGRALELYGEKARAQQAALTGFPPRGEEKNYQELNDFATILFVQAEALMNNGKTSEAIAAFQNIIDNYNWAQTWDPRGWFWSVAEKSQDSINVMLGKIKEEEDEEIKDVPVTVPKLHQPGLEDVVDYRKYGEFLGVGTVNYRYKLKDPKALADAAGEGIYPNTGQKIVDNPGYKEAVNAGRLEGDHWSFVQSTDLEAAFYKWVRAPEPTGLKLFYIGIIFEKAGMYEEAIKAYHALIVHFPKTIGWTYWQTPWYPAEAAVAKIKHIIRTHPELNLKVKWMDVKVENAFDNETGNDRFVVRPGVIEKKSWVDQAKEKFEKDRKVKLGPVKKRVGEGRVRLVQYENGHWQMLVDGKPFIIKGVTYAPTKVGQSPDKGTLVSWMKEDVNNNGKPDGPYDSWVDKNLNNQQDPDEPVVGDFQLMKEMGVNVVREYHQPFEPDKQLLRKMHEEYGFMVAMGDFLGKYTHGSGATWFEGTDYENEEHKKNMMESVRKMVMEFKDEPYILLWVLGNENNYGIASNADKKPEAYFKFANEVARMIKSIDPDHPVALCNGDTLFLDKFAANAPDIDIFAANVYRGDYGFGSFWRQVKEAAGKPAFITEYGAPAYARHLTREEAEKAQADYHRGNWGDIAANTAGREDGAGNALGGIVFEWADEWWKNYEPFYHDRRSDAVGPFPGGYYYEEWFGITGQGNGQSSPFLRHLRESYFAYQEMWSRP